MTLSLTRKRFYMPCPSAHMRTACSLSSTCSKSAWVQAKLKLARHVAQGQDLDLTNPSRGWIVYKAWLLRLVPKEQSHPRAWILLSAQVVSSKHEQPTQRTSSNCDHNANWHGSCAWTADELDAARRSVKNSHAFSAARRSSASSMGRSYMRCPKCTPQLRTWLCGSVAWNVRRFAMWLASEECNASCDNSVARNVTLHERVFGVVQRNSTGISACKVSCFFREQAATVILAPGHSDCLQHLQHSLRMISGRSWNSVQGGSRQLSDRVWEEAWCIAWRRKPNPRLHSVLPGLAKATQALTTLRSPFL